jgi:hypothetical protein
VAGHSLLFALTEVQHPYSKIILYDAPDFFPSCSLNSTAIVASRGVTIGHSDLGDLLVKGYETFSKHFMTHAPKGIELITQFTGTKSKIDQFKIRYPLAKSSLKAGEINLRHEYFLGEEKAFQITPKVYLKWLQTQSQSKLNLEIRHELFKDDSSQDDMVFCSGAVNSLWKDSFPETAVQKTKSAQGAYFEFPNVDYALPSFGLTLEGHNLIYHKNQKILLLGSTTHELNHYLPPFKDLEGIYSFIQENVDMKLPAISEGIIKVGLREKAPKRLPYISKAGRKFAMGGFYKNGFSLGLEFSRSLCRELLVS